MARAHQRHHGELQPFAGVHGQHLDGVGGRVEAARAFAHLVRQAALAQHAGAFVHLAVVPADDGHVAPGVAFDTIHRFSSPDSALWLAASSNSPEIDVKRRSDTAWLSRKFPTV